MEMNWSRWFHCESSFGLLLVPSQPGIFALAEEIVQPANERSRRMLAVFEVEEAEDLSRAMSRLFAAGSPWREKMSQARCYVRYAIAPGIADRRAAAMALKNWLNSQREVASQIFEKPLSVPSELELAIAPAQILARPEPVNGRANEELKTMAERAVDRVTQGVRLSKAIPAGF
jgi:acyl-CoA reductase-like NAD-dependent aldehyde dehydrogenase